MTTITKERLLTIKQWRETYGPGSNVVLPAEEAEELARIALASLEADPVKRVNSDQMRRVCLEANRHLDKYDAMAKEVNKLLGRIAPPAPIALEAIENAIEYIRSIAFHIDEDDYHGKHIAYFMRQALAWLEGHSCSDDRLGKADNQPVRGNQAAESNRGNEWAGNPDIDNAIIMLDRIDTAESYDDDRIEAVKAVLRRLAGNSPVTPDGWISCSDRMPEDTKMLLAFSQGEIVAAYWNWVVNPIDYKKYRTFTYLSGNILDDVTHWMPLPEPPL
ncbi:DUF551 domain-containing protein [Escherichia coli]|nr:DUF551 domain-containing protein [Escherichia coli]